MNMIGLDCRLGQLPTVLSDNFINDLFQPVLNWPNQHMPPSLRAKDEMVDNEMHTMSIMLAVPASLTTCTESYSISGDTSAQVVVIALLVLFVV